jgi:hypothetical protein
MALMPTPIDRETVDAIADNPDDVDELLFKINSDRKTAAALAKHGIYE